MPNRILREGINDSRAINKLTDTGEILYRRLMSVVDDYGRFEADPELLRGEMFKRKLDQWPSDRIVSALKELSETFTEEGEPLLLIYKSGFRQYLEITKFNQRLRGKTSKFPEPTSRQYVDSRRQSADISGDPPQSAADCGENPPSARSSASAKTSASAAAEVEPPQRKVVPFPDFTDEPSLMEHHPETRKAIVSIFEDADDSLVRALITKCVQEVIGVGRPAELVTDELIAYAVHRCTKRNQHSAGMYLNTVPVWFKNKALEDEAHA